MPKYIKLEMLPPTASILQPFSTAGITQEIRLSNGQQGEKGIAIKFKLNYSVNGQSVSTLSKSSSWFHAVIGGRAGSGHFFSSELLER